MVKLGIGMLFAVRTLMPHIVTITKVHLGSSHRVTMQPLPVFALTVLVALYRDKAPCTAERSAMKPPPRSCVDC
jgi:hypothetical protein